MKNYFDELNNTLKEYFHILSPEIPEFLNEYIQTPEMQKQSRISVTCGGYYTNMCSHRLWYSSLDHSVGVALIIWNFTKDKKQTLAGLFHDIATPVFKHAIDCMNGDYKKQESTEEYTTQIISNSKEIMALLERDSIKLNEVNDYQIYPIADNDTPKLSADRLEYTLSNAIGVRQDIWSLEEAKEIYQDIEIQKNEEQIIELGFKNKEMAEKFVAGMRILSHEYLRNEIKYSMQLLADILKRMSEENLISKEDLYKLSEREVIEKIEKCELDGISEKFKIWRNATKVNESEYPVEEKYCVSINVKIRYINPLVRQGNKFIRAKDISDSAKDNIEKCLNFKTKKYAYLDFDL